MTKERPILMNGAMVRATLRDENPKTQTRRVVKFPRWLVGEPPEMLGHDDVGIQYGDGHRGPGFYAYDDEYPEGSETIDCPFGKVGDHLWVRETFQPLWTEDYPGDYRTGEGYEVSYPATDGIKEFCDPDAEDITSRCYPSIHMPRWASRITLEITNVRVERLQDISEEDAKAEGVEAVIGKKIHVWSPHVLEFSLLWDSIYGNWRANPWLWAITFKRIKP